MKINVRPVAPKLIFATELKAGDKFVTATPLGPGTCVYTRLNVPLASPYAALTDTLGLARLDANQLVYRYPAEPATTTVGQLQPGDLFMYAGNSPPSSVYMLTDEVDRDGDRRCVKLTEGPGVGVGTIVYLAHADTVSKVEVVE